MRKLIQTVALMTVTFGAQATIIDMKTAYESMHKSDQLQFMKAVNSMKVGETQSSVMPMKNGDVMGLVSSGHINYIGYDCKNYGFAFKSGAQVEGLVCNVGTTSKPEWIFLKD